MKKIKLQKAIASSLMIASVLALFPIAAHATWKKDTTGHWYTEGSSWATGWRQIDNQWYYFNSDGYAAEGWKQVDGNWYYFSKTVNYDFGSFQTEDRGGVMSHDSIVDGCYVNSSGAWSNGGAEIDAFAKLLNDTQWQRDNGIIFSGGKSTIDANIILDINQDGVSEMLIHHGSSEANKSVTVVTYNNGNVKADTVNSDHGGYMGYNSAEKTFYASGSNMGAFRGSGYKLEDGKCVKVSSWYTYEREGSKSYKVNDQEVSAEEYQSYITKIK